MKNIEDLLLQKKHDINTNDRIMEKLIELYKDYCNKKDNPILITVSNASICFKSDGIEFIKNYTTSNPESIKIDFIKKTNYSYCSCDSKTLYLESALFLLKFNDLINFKIKECFKESSLEKRDVDFNEKEYQFELGKEILKYL